MYEQVPSELKSLKHWCIYKLVWDEKRKKYTKIPYNAYTGKKAKSNDERTWSDFQTALSAIEKYEASGLGFFFKPPYFGIDIDNAEGEVERYRSGDVEENIIYEFIETMKSYSEYSQSGTGIHIIAKGLLPDGRRRKGDVEMYTDGRFFAMTGNSASQYTRINSPAQVNINRLHDRYVADKKVIKFEKTPSLESTVDLPVAEIIEKARNAKQGARFKVFMDGGWEAFYESQSEADMAFANDLAFWTGRDFDKMDEIFRMSSLMRQKYDNKHGSKTYGQALLDKAIHETQSVYNPKRKSDFKIFIKEQEQPKEKKYYSYDDTGNADRFCDIYGTLVRYSYIDKTWHYYDGKVWMVDNTGEVRKMVDTTVEIMAAEPIELSDDMDKEAKEAIKKAFERHVKRSRGNAGKNAMMDEVKHRLAVLPEEFDRDKTLFNCDNGYLSLTSGDLHDHEIGKMFTRLSKVEYTDTIDAPQWEEFIEQTFAHDQDLIRYVQKAVGYSLTGSTQEQCMFILYGGGANGKSVFLDIISDIMGNYAMTMQAQTIMVKQNQSAANSDIARLKGARLVTSSEPNEGVRLDEGLVKQLTGGDKVTARQLYGKEFEFEPEFKLWLATNHRPIIRGTDDGIWRRLNLIPFTVQVPEEKKDKMLKYKLRTELVGILKWAVEGCLMWQREGLKPPQSVLQASNEYRAEMDQIGQFVSECCEIGPGRTIAGGEIYKIYKEWAVENGEHVFNNTKFGRELSKRYSKRKSHGIAIYEGITLKPKKYDNVRQLFK
ncbi:DNA primase [Enterococcus hirae]|nr:DNA primase [Enterococcus hirae]